MRFEEPLLILLVLAGPALLFLRLRRGRAASVPLSLPADVRDAPPTRRARLLWVPAALAAAALALAALAAASPHARTLYEPDPRRARDIALVIDCSESMRGIDFQLGGGPVSRMQAALHLTSEFIGRREGDRIAIVAFGGHAVTQCPLTFDRRVARTLLGYVEPEMLGKRTALGDGVALAAARLEGGGAIVLLSDGASTAGRVTPAEAARAAAARGVRIYAVAIGSDGPVRVPSRLPSGRTRMVMKDYAPDRQTLRRLAELTGGRYAPAEDIAGLRAILEGINRLERKDVTALRPVPAGRMGRHFALAAAALLAALTVLSATALRAAPRMA